MGLYDTRLAAQGHMLPGFLVGLVCQVFVVLCVVGGCMNLRPSTFFIALALWQVHGGRQALVCARPETTEAQWRQLSQAMHHIKSKVSDELRLVGAD